MTISLLWLPGDSELRLAQGGRREPTRALSPRGGVYGIIGLVPESALRLVLTFSHCTRGLMVRPWKIGTLTLRLGQASPQTHTPLWPTDPEPT